jgi:hypothetical protein
VRYYTFANFKARMEGGRKPGRPRKRWLDDAEHELQQLGVRNWRLKARDRVDWTTVVLVMMIIHSPMFHS